MEKAHNVGRRLGILEIAARQSIRERLTDDRGEGVVSMAIAILIIASIGAVLWGIFNASANNLGTRVDSQIQQVGN